MSIMSGFFSGSDDLLLLLCGLFYSLLCIFSMVTGLIYMSGKRKLNPLELPDSFVSRLDEEDRLLRFTRRMGFVTFLVGIVQGISAYAILKAGNAFFYVIASGFTLFSIASVLFKLKGKINAFPLLKLLAYLFILFVLIIKRDLFFS